MSDILTAKEQGSTPPAQENSAGLSQDDWAAYTTRVREARGKFAWVRTSSQEFSRRKQEEIEREAEQSERRMR